MEVAVKVLRSAHLDSEETQISDEFDREIEFMQRTRHTNIVR